MKKYKLHNSGDRGWFIGNFPIAVYQTDKFEVAYQINQRSHAASHYHEKITEISLITAGKCLVNGEIFTAGDIYVLQPGDISQIEFLEETAMVTIKTPGIPTDKVLL